ncbi:MAG TPA: hypothetical protein PK385_01125 [Spirochaetota bacterium]|nr:hypothetical protein [Spirochaetota bacterium]HOS32571.1 hypothetical protein [Spirochaetota bacterium]HOS54641.1 hypothetical protein [Spirochaetota bacterium]HQF77339.1 hypothetical protein [Spirochaetota bacterium]HQH31373.1 hypothetical protein [Spirochaetota bacterium]
MKRNLILITLFLSISFSAFPQLKINFYWRNRYYSAYLIETKEIILDNPFVSIHNIENDQRMKTMLSVREKSKILSLKYVGDSYKFNDVELSSVQFKNNTDLEYYENKYYIYDQKNKFGIIFGIGDYDSIVLYSYLNFSENEKKSVKDRFKEYDLLASTFAVKILLKKISGEINNIINIPRKFEADYFENEILPYIEREEDKKRLLARYEKKAKSYVLKYGLSENEEKEVFAYLRDATINKKSGSKNIEREKILNKFINQLKNQNVDKVFEYLAKFVRLNVSVSISKNNICSNWITPSDLYYFKKGDKKSVALFYYYILNKLGYRVRAYLVTDMGKKSYEDVAKEKKLSANDRQSLDSLYNQVNPKYNREEVLRYYHPKFEDSVFLVALESNGKWIYTTGEKWIDGNILKEDRVCVDYMKKSCYYTYLPNVEYFIGALPLMKSDIVWDIFFSLE